jgi:hypothetical protein
MPCGPWAAHKTGSGQDAVHVRTIGSPAAVASRPTPDGPGTRAAGLPDLRWLGVGLGWEGTA